MVIHIALTSRVLGILGLLLITSCMDRSERVPDRSDAEKNLAAIRELFKPADGRGANQFGRPGADTTGDGQEGFQNSNDALPSSGARTANSHYIPPDRQYMANSKETIHSGQTQVYIPWRPAATNASEMADPFRPVPPYMTIMPVVPGSPSPVRCRPDFSGGQRCN